MKFRILSFNVLAQNWIDRQLRRVVDEQFLIREYRIEKHIQAFKRVQPEVMLLQEVTPIVLSRYQKALPDYAEGYFTPIHWMPAGRDPVNGNAILWHKEFATQITGSRIALSRRKGNYAQMLSAVLNKTRQSLHFVNVHLEYGNLESAKDEFHHIFSGGFVRTQKHVIIAGDFNMGGDVDAFPIVHDIEKHGFVDAAPKLRTHPFENEPETVTHLLGRGVQIRGATIVGRGTRSINECLKRYGSDHFPVVATISI